MVVDLKAKPFYLNDVQRRWVEATLNGMTVQEKIEQVMFPLSYTTDEEYLADKVQRNQYGGLMFRAGDAAKTQAAINAVQKASKIPMFVAANLEDGGNGIAVQGTYMGRQMLISATNDTKKAYQLAKICGREGKAVGVNWTFAPVIDIDYNFRNPITNVRTYGSDPKQVLAMARAYQKGADEENLLTSIKHFPGDGVDERDQHLLTSINSLDITKWEKSYGKLYRTLIEEGAKTVMVGHIAMPAMEELFEQEPCKEIIPASLSKNVVKNYLRGEIGFNGLISTDASPMVGFACAMERKKAVPMAIANGCDILLFTRDEEEDLEFMMQGYKDGILTEERLNEAVTRILGMKAAMGLPEAKQSGTIIKKSADLEILGCSEHAAWAEECADMGITLVKDTQKLLPIDRKRFPRVLLEILGDFPSNDRVYGQFEELLKKEGFEVTQYVPETPDTIFKDLKVQDFTEKYDLVIYVANIENASNNTTARIHWHTLFGAGNNLPWFVNEVPVLFISVGNPYHLFDAPMIKTFINGYCHSPYVIEAVVEKIMGRSEFKGKSPIDPFCSSPYLKL